MPRRGAARPGSICRRGIATHPAYGDSPRYNDFYCDQLTELLTQLRPIAEVWFDGANGEGPNGKRQVYDWPRFWALVRRLQPDAVMFSDAGPDVRWCGNERGVAGDPNWSTVDPAVVPFPGAERARRSSTRCSTAIPTARCGARRRSTSRSGPAGSIIPPRTRACGAVDNLVDLYFTSVGRNAKLLLNVPPTREGCCTTSTSSG